MADVVAANAVRGVWPGYHDGLVQQPSWGHFKLRRVFLASSNTSYYISYNLWTRVDMNFNHKIEWDNSLNTYGIADNVGLLQWIDPLGNTFRSFLVACDIQDLLAAGFYSQPVKNGNFPSNFFFSSEGRIF